MADVLRDDIRLSAVVTAIAVHHDRVEMTLESGEVITAANVVCAMPVGSDYWVAGYMEGAVRSGRAAAREALRRG